jgi:hypothetical protein
MATSTLDVGINSPSDADDIQNVRHHVVTPPGRITISEADFRTIDHLLAMSKPRWQATHMAVPDRGRNIVIITEAQPIGYHTASLLIAPFGIGYLVFFHGSANCDADEDYVVSSCQSISELCDVISWHCLLQRAEVFTYTGVPYLSDTNSDEVWDAISVMR